MDRGRDAILPLVDELRAAFAEHKLLILTGAGIRARHILGVGARPRPADRRARRASPPPRPSRTAHLLAALLAKHGVSYVAAPHRRPPAGDPPRRQPGRGRQRLPAVRRLRVPPGRRPIPLHRADTGAFLSPTPSAPAARSTSRTSTASTPPTPTPGRNRRPELRDKVSASELLRTGTTPADRSGGPGADGPRQARHGDPDRQRPDPGALTKALRGEPVGTVVHADPGRRRRRARRAGRRPRAAVTSLRAFATGWIDDRRGEA